MHHSTSSDDEDDDNTNGDNESDKSFDENLPKVEEATTSLRKRKRKFSTGSPWWTTGGYLMVTR